MSKQQQAPLASLERDLPVIAVEAEDDVAAVCGKMDARSEQQVVLYIRRNPSFRDPLSFNRIRRHAYLTGKESLIVSPNNGVRSLSASAGLPTFAGVREAERYASGVGRITIFGRSIALPWFPQSVLRTLTIVAALVAGLLAGGCLLIPSATIRISPQLQQIDTLPFEATASTDFDEINVENNELPARRFEQEIVVELGVPTTGREIVGEIPATGDVVLFNLTSQEITAPAGLEVETADGIIFRIDEELTLPPGPETFAGVPVTAVGPGEAGNVDAQAINEILGDLTEELAVLNNDPTAGGENRNANVVTQDDVDLLDGLVSGAIQQRGLELLRERFEGEDSEDQRVIIEGTLNTREITGALSPELGGEGDFVFLRTTALVSVLTVDYEVIQRYAAQAMAAEAEEGLVVDPETVLFDIITAENISETQTSVDISFQANGQAGTAIDKDEVEDLVRGKSEDGAREALEERYELEEPPEVDIGPGPIDWVTRFGFRLDVEVD